MYFRLDRRLCSLSSEEEMKGKTVAVFTREEAKEKTSSTLPISLALTISPGPFCKAEPFLDRIQGTFFLPPRGDRKKGIRFCYVIEKDSLLFLDDSGFVLSQLNRIQKNREWDEPGIGRLFSDFLELLIQSDREYLEKLENRIAETETEILRGQEERHVRLLAFRKEVMTLNHYYSQLLDMAEEMQEEENRFFTNEEQRLFKLFGDRADRLFEKTRMLREYLMQLQEVYRSQLDMRQNRIMKILTVVTAIFSPLSLIVGWYGMNFQHMPELSWRFGYPAVALLCLAAVGFCLWLFKKKHFW